MFVLEDVMTEVKGSLPVVGEDYPCGPCGYPKVCTCGCVLTEGNVVQSCSERDCEICGCCGSDCCPECGEHACCGGCI